MGASPHRRQRGPGSLPVSPTQGSFSDTVLHQTHSTVEAKPQAVRNTTIHKWSLNGVPFVLTSTPLCWTLGFPRTPRLSESSSLPGSPPHVGRLNGRKGSKGVCPNRACVTPGSGANRLCLFTPELLDPRLTHSWGTWHLQHPGLSPGSARELLAASGASIWGAPEPSSSKRAC